MPTTSNFGWTTPADTDLVKDGAAAIRTLGSAIDTSLVDLKGGTTGQVLAKASGTDMDFTWSSVDPLTILDAKGDLISATAADTPARLAVGADGTYLQADSSTSTGLKWGTVSAGGMTLLASGSLPAATSLNLTSISGSYKDLVLSLIGFSHSGVAGEYKMRFNNDSNVRYVTADAFSTTAMSFNDTQYPITNNVRTSPDYNIVRIYIPEYANTATWKYARTESFTVNETTATDCDFRTRFFLYNQTTAISEINILAPGSFDAGTYKLYGVN